MVGGCAVGYKCNSKNSTTMYKICLGIGHYIAKGDICHVSKKNYVMHILLLLLTH